jgi:hypothetical protein
MPQIPIDADTLFRAVSATGYKLLAFHLDLNTGKISSRTLRPEEVAPLPDGPSVKPLPKMGGDLSAVKPNAPPPLAPLPSTQKKKLFADDDGPKKPKFAGDFWQRDDKKKDDLFKDGGFRRENATKKLAEIFGDPKPQKPPEPASTPSPAEAAKNPFGEAPKDSVQPIPGISDSTLSPDDPKNPRIPAATEQLQLQWMFNFARDCGAPEIRDELMTAFKATQPASAFERILRKYQRMNQQWDRYFRKQALDYAESWLSDLGIQWELIEPDAPKL